MDIHCVDTWDGGIEHKEWGTDMQGVECQFAHITDVPRRFAANPASLTLHEATPDSQLSKLVAEGRSGVFALVHMDASHRAPNMLKDVCLGSKRPKIGEVLPFDDYARFQRLPSGKAPLRCPKPVIDAVVNLRRGASWIWGGRDPTSSPFARLPTDAVGDAFSKTDREVKRGV